MPSLPVVTTTSVSNISSTTATSGGTVSDDGGSAIVAKGVCWDISAEPSVGKGHWNTTLSSILYGQNTVEYAGMGSYISSLTQLSPSTQYYIRAYATNKAGTSYGNEETFTTVSDSTGTVTDIDGNRYNTITVGTQTWIKENLKTTRFRNGTELPLVRGRLDWYYLYTPAYCWYDNKSENGAVYGALYNWFAVNAGSDPNMSLCPAGWHIPSDKEWTILMDFLGGDSVAVGKLKEAEISHWASPNNDATNESRFTALPGGFRDFEGSYYGLYGFGFWWSTTEIFPGGAWGRFMGYDGSGGFRFGRYENDGLSVRCVKD